MSATQPLSPGRVTLAHLACALALPLAIQAISKTQNGSTNSSSVWSLKDEEGGCVVVYTTVPVCTLVYVYCSVPTCNNTVGLPGTLTITYTAHNTQ